MSFVLSACSVCLCLITWLFTVAQFCLISSLRNSHRPSDPGSSWQTVLGNEATDPIPYCSASLLFRFSCFLSSLATGLPSSVSVWRVCQAIARYLEKHPWTAPGEARACARTPPTGPVLPLGPCQLLHQKAGAKIKQQGAHKLLAQVTSRHGIASGGHTDIPQAGSMAQPGADAPCCPPPASIGELHA